IVGSPWKFQSSRMPLSCPFHRCVQGCFSLARNFVVVSFFVSALMLTKTKNSSLSRLAIARSCGITALHGVHHVTPTSSTTTFPRSQSAPGSGSGALRNGAHRWNQQVVEGSGGTSNRSQTEPRCNSLLLLCDLILAAS